MKEIKLVCQKCKAKITPEMCDLDWMDNFTEDFSPDAPDITILQRYICTCGHEGSIYYGATSIQ